MRACTLAVAIALATAGCAGSSVPAPIGRAPARDAGDARPRAGVHRVGAGDTLYAIAWRYGLDYRDVATWNGIPEPFVIHPGQVLRLTRPAVLPSTEAASPDRDTVRATRADPASRPAASRAEPQRAKRTSPPPRDQRAVSSWQWPTRGKVTGAFGGAGGNGIDIAGRRGQAISAAANGRVVYSGSGLRGYGKLIIVKHNKRYLSAYAHNDQIHVKEGDTVKSGQRIADMGSTDSKTVRLHFEIRRDGKPVDPIRFLPR